MIPIYSISSADVETCVQCRKGQKLDFELRFAYQPIVDIVEQSVVAYEALVRGPNGEGAAQVLGRVTPDNLYVFDQTCRVEAIRGAVRLGMRERLSVNFLPNSMSRAVTCIQSTVMAAREQGFPVENIIFEVSEAERIQDRAHLVHIISGLDELGFHTAIDDFGAGYAGLELLSDYQPDILKLDMGLIRDIDVRRPRQAILKAVLTMCVELDIQVLAEGVESPAERDYLAAAGIRLMQGYLFGRPALDTIGEIDPCVWP